MFCRNCGKEIENGTNYCPYCGVSQEQQQVYKNVSDQNPSGWWAVLCFFFPLIGLILYLVWRDDKPNTAKMCGKGALTGVIVSVVFSILYAILAAILIAGSIA